MPAYKDPHKGTWYVKIRYTDWQGNRKETTKRGFSTKRQAKEYEDEYKRKVQGTADMTLESLYDIYYADRKKHIKESSLAVIDYAVKKHVLPPLGNLPLSSITPNTIRKWQNGLDNKLSSTSIHNINRRLSAILNFAVKFYGLQKNPLKVTGIQGKSERRIDFWSKEEFDSFISVVDHPLYRALFLLLFYTGMRVGEALALTMEDIDFDTCTVKITKTFSLKQKSTPPKTPSSNRTVILPASISKVMQDTVEALPYDSGRIFPLLYQTVRNKYNQALAESQVRPLSIHCLRHAHASLLISKGVPIPAISKRLGHTSPQITLSIYAHPTQNSDQDIANMLDVF